MLKETICGFGISINITGFLHTKKGCDYMEYFGANKIIKQHICQDNLCTYFVGFDLDDSGNNYYRINELIKLLIKVIPEFAFAHHLGKKTSNTEIVERLCEAADAVYSIDEFQKVRDICLNGKYQGDVADKYLKRGEFGELILHLLLRDYKDTIPLISKVYFRDSYGTAVHGFDAVHIQESEKTLWLGESKLYTDGKKGVSALIEDIKEHFNSNYLNSEFAIVSRKIKKLDNIPEREHWLDLLNESTTMREQLKNINIPLLCTYESSLFTKYSDESMPEFVSEYEKEMNKLKDYFDAKNDHPLKSKLNIILLLFPVQCKKELVTGLHRKLSMMQSIGGA
ncbi:hypothetical protein DSECCO2_532830 [anaerobic digester metagenome]